MDDYSLIPQLYQQGLQHGLDRQFQLATSAQPVSRFLDALRQSRMDQMARDQLDRQNRLADIQEQRVSSQEEHQRALEKMGFISHISTELNPSNAGSYRELSQDLFGKDYVPAARQVERPKIEATDYGPDQGKSPLGGGLPLAPQGTPEIPAYTETVEPTGSRYQQKGMEIQGKLEARRYAQDIKSQIADMQNTTRNRGLDIRDTRVAAQNNLDQVRADKAAKQIEEIQRKLDLGFIDAQTAKLQADAALNYAKGSYIGGAQTEHTEALTANLGQPMTTIQTQGSAPPKVTIRTRGGTAPAPGRTVAMHDPKGRPLAVPSDKVDYYKNLGATVD